MWSLRGQSKTRACLFDDFPADCPLHQMHFHFPTFIELRVSSTGYLRGFQQIAKFVDAVTSEGRNSITTSPQSRIPPSTAPSLRLGHRLRVLPTFVV